jgi:hypothetical protein
MLVPSQSPVDSITFINLCQSIDEDAIPDGSSPDNSDAQKHITHDESFVFRAINTYMNP